MPDRVPAGPPGSVAARWGERYGYSRAVRAGNVIEVAGTTAPGDSAYDQAKAALRTIEQALTELVLLDPEHAGRVVPRR